MQAHLFQHGAHGFGLHLPATLAGYSDGLTGPSKVLA
jgi:hypothetical protein